jgi:hypothetical protein
MPRIHGVEPDVSAKTPRSKRRKRATSTARQGKQQSVSPLTFQRLVTEVELENILILSNRCYPSIRILMGRHIAMVGEIQLRWLQEIENGTEKPLWVATSTRGLQRQLAHLVPDAPVRKQSIAHLQSRVREIRTQHLAKAVPSNVLSLVHSPPTSVMSECMSSFQGMQALLKNVQSQKIITQLQEIFVLLTCHLCHTCTKYEELLQETGWSNKQALNAEYFVAHLLAQDVEDV